MIYLSSLLPRFLVINTLELKQVSFSFCVRKFFVAPSFVPLEKLCVKNMYRGDQKNIKFIHIMAYF